MTNQEYAQEYAKRLAYRFDITTKYYIPESSTKTCGDIAKCVLPLDKLEIWYKEQTVEIEQLRRKFGLKPFDKFNAPFRIFLYGQVFQKDNVV